MKPWRAAVALGALLAAAGTVHTLVNLRRLLVPPSPAPACDERVAVLLPARDEAPRIAAAIAGVRAQRAVPSLCAVVLDDGSTDGTGTLARAAAEGDARVEVLDGGGAPPPEGWLGKTWACARLASHVLHDELPDGDPPPAGAGPDVLVFLDADVVLEPDAVAAAVALLRSSGLDLVSPYPRQEAVTAAERLVQPLLQWSWLTTVPLGLAARSPRPSFAVANGQLLVVDAAAYRRAGGHEAVRGEVLDDVALLRAVLRSGGHGTVADGTALATCRMYDGAGALVEGYTKSLWSAFGSKPGAAAVVGALSLTYVVPALGLLSRDPRTRAIGAVGYGAGVIGRALVARRTGGRAWPDALAHPASVAAFAGLTALSWWRHDAGVLTWKGRTLP